MNSENYRQVLNNEFDSKEMSKEDFDNTLIEFAKVFHQEQLENIGYNIYCNCVQKAVNYVGPNYRSCGNCGKEIR
jgi:hypothetical protein